MALFTASDRQSIVDYIVSFTERNEHIVALIAVGSGSFGYIDELSDVDFVVAIDAKEHLDAVRDYVADELRKRASFLYFKQAPNIPLQVYLCENFLEIDIGYGVCTSAAATRAHWKVLFDKSGAVHEAMRNSWEKAKDAPKADEYAKALFECSDRAWHNLMHCAVAIRRNQRWRAAAELDIARNLLVKLLGFRYSLDTERGRELDLLPEFERERLQTTLVRDFSPDSLWSSLACLTDAIYTELERNEEASRIRVNRQQVHEYLSACRNLLKRRG